MISNKNEELWRPIGYTQRLRALDLEGVADWMRTQGWFVVQNDELSDLWMVVTNNLGDYVDFPHSNEVGDFVSRMNEVVEAISIAKGWRGWVTLEVLEAV
jgi:hypothetical protein